MADEITLHTGFSRSVTIVSNTFIDYFMAEANGEYVKIYLYLLRSLNKDNTEFSISAMAEKLGHTQLDIQRALKYFEERHLLCLEYDSAHTLRGICLLDPDRAGNYYAPATLSVTPQRFTIPMTASTLPIPAPMAPIQTGMAVQPRVEREPEPKTYSPEEIAALNENEDVRELLFIAEQYMQHPLTVNDTNMLLFWYDELHLSADVVEYLIEFCVEKGHNSIHYMNKVALSWAGDGVETIEDARTRNNIYSQSYYAVMKAFGISGRSLIPEEQSYIEKWTKKYHLSLEVISEACRRTVANTGQVNFKYADKILSSWFENSVDSLTDVEKIDKAHNDVAPRGKKKPKDGGNGAVKTKFHNFEDRDNNYDNLELKLLDIK